MTRISAATATVAVAVALSGLIIGCGSASPAARPTVTVTVTAHAGSAVASQPTGPSPTPGGPPACPTSVLSGSVGQANGAAGSIYYPVDFTNTSSAACTLYGYPGISFVTAAGRQVGAAATENPAYPRTLVTVSPGATVHAELKVARAENYLAADCDPRLVHRLRVYPPGQTSALILSLTATACANTAITLLDVQTVQAGAGNL